MSLKFPPPSPTGRSGLESSTFTPAYMNPNHPKIPSVEVPISTVDQICNLLNSMVASFEQHGMEDLATQAGDVADLLAR